MLGETPTSSVKRLLKVPGDEQPTAEQTSARPSAATVYRVLAEGK